MELTLTKTTPPPANVFVLGAWDTANGIPSFEVVKRSKRQCYVNRHGEAELIPKYWIELPTLPKEGN